MTPERAEALIRAVEEKIVEVYPSDVMQTPVHLSIGQELVAATVCSHLNSDDLKIGTHRSHALYIANGGDLVKFFKELLGKPGGCSGGRGGSMHLTDPEHGLLGTTSIVGGCFPIACGLAMTIERPRIVACFFGDGACDQGVFYESLNFAVLKNLPILFVCEDNGVSVETRSEIRHRHPWKYIRRAAEGAGILVPPGCYTDMAPRPSTALAAIECTRESQPVLVHWVVPRCYGHQGVSKEMEAPPIDIPDSIREEVELAWQEASRELDNQPQSP